MKAELPKVVYRDEPKPKRKKIDKLDIITFQPNTANVSLATKLNEIIDELNKRLPSASLK